MSTSLAIRVFYCIRKRVMIIPELVVKKFVRLVFVLGARQLKLVLLAELMIAIATGQLFIMKGKRFAGGILTALCG